MTGLLQPGSTHRWAGLEWQVHAAPGHDPHSVILFAPAAGVLISADALWQHGFGVVFPELQEIAGFDDVAATLDLIERLAPRTVIPGHGAVFHDVYAALQTARSKLDGFARAPHRHLRYGAKVLLKFKLLEFGQIAEQAARMAVGAVKNRVGAVIDDAKLQREGKAKELEGEHRQSRNR